GHASADDLAVATRSGVKQVRVDAVGVAADMGPPRFLGQSAAVVAGRRLVGAGVSMGNPHLVCQLPAAEVDAMDLSQPPRVDHAMFPHGVNVEFFGLLGPRHLKLRVHERGVGETASCGTGVCAAAAVALRDADQHTGEVTVEVPGGHLAVTLDSQTSWLAGPAVITAEGALTPQWLELEHAD
ncbi:MAG: diaminopimelate epimerase, partial [Micromonosporaceae bacterium]